MKKKNSACFFMIAIILVSCSPQRRLIRLLEKNPELQVYDTVYMPGIIKYRDTVVKVKIPGDTVYKESVEYIYEPWTDTGVWIDPVSPPFLNIPPVVNEVELAYSKAWVDQNILKSLLIQKDSILKFKLDSVRRVSKDTLRITNTIKYQVPTDPNPFWRNGFFVLAGLILISLILLFVFWKR
jgi:hypothetical protein